MLLLLVSGRVVESPAKIVTGPTPDHLFFSEGESPWGYLDVPARKLGSMVIGSVGYSPNVYTIYIGYNPLILTSDPYFQRDIQVMMFFSRKRVFPLFAPGI